MEALPVTKRLSAKSEMFFLNVCWKEVRQAPVS